MAERVKPKGWMAPRSGGYVPAAAGDKKKVAKIVPPKGGGGVVVGKRHGEPSVPEKSS